MPTISAMGGSERCTKIDRYIMACMVSSASQFRPRRLFVSLGTHTAISQEVGEEHIADEKSRQEQVGDMRRRCLDSEVGKWEYAWSAMAGGVGMMVW